MIFDGFLGGGPELSTPGRLGKFGSFLGLIAVTEQYGVALQNAKYSIKPAGIKGCDNNRMETTKNEKARLQYYSTPTEEPGYRIEDILLCLVAPLPRGRWIFL